MDEVGYIIEPDAVGRDNIPIVEESQLFPPLIGNSSNTSPPPWCQNYWWCSAGRDDFPGSIPDTYIPIENSHNLNETECFFISGVCLLLKKLLIIDI